MILPAPTMSRLVVCFGGATDDPGLADLLNKQTNKQNLSSLSTRIAEAMGD
jgi:hypothetical protein